MLVGPANAGKSALVEALTNATPEVSPAPQTTWQPTPGMLEVGHVQFQLIDTPSIDRDFIEPALMDLIRRADLVLPVVDLTMDPNRQLEETLEQLRHHRIDPTVESNGRRKMEYAPILVLANKCDDAEAEENLEIFRRLLEGDWPVVAASAVYRPRAGRAGLGDFPSTEDYADLLENAGQRSEYGGSIRDEAGRHSGGIRA